MHGLHAPPQRNQHEGLLILGIQTESKPDPHNQSVRYAPARTNPKRPITAALRGKAKRKHSPGVSHMGKSQRSVHCRRTASSHAQCQHSAHQTTLKYKDVSRFARNMDSVFGCHPSSHPAITAWLGSNRRRWHIRYSDTDYQPPLQVKQLSDTV